MDIIVSISSVMTNYLLLTESDVQRQFSTYLRAQRRKAKLSRKALAERSTVPASTIKKFELSGQISFRQLLLLWQSLDDLSRLYQLTREQPSDNMPMPKSIDEVLKQNV